MRTKGMREVRRGGAGRAGAAIGGKGGVEARDVGRRAFRSSGRQIVRGRNRERRGRAILAAPPSSRGAST